MQPLALSDARIARPFMALPDAITPKQTVGFQELDPIL